MTWKSHSVTFTVDSVSEQVRSHLDPREGRIGSSSPWKMMSKNLCTCSKSAHSCAASRDTWTSLWSCGRCEWVSSKERCQVLCPSVTSLWILQFGPWLMFYFMRASCVYNFSPPGTLDFKPVTMCMLDGYCTLRYILYFLMIWVLTDLPVLALNLG